METNSKNQKFYAGDLIEYNLLGYKVIGTKFEQGIIVKVVVISKNERKYHVLNSKKVTVINDKIYRIRPMLQGE